MGNKEGVGAQTTATVRFYSLIFVLSFLGWANLARLVRGEVLSLREREFIQAARVIGVPTRKVLFKELVRCRASAGRWCSRPRWPCRRSS